MQTFLVTPEHSQDYNSLMLRSGCVSSWLVTVGRLFSPGWLFFLAVFAVRQRNAGYVFVCVMVGGEDDTTRKQSTGR